jgi:hypothetical protein
MTQQNTSATTETTEVSDTTNQAVKTFTQDEVNAIIARNKSQLEKKFTSKYDELGDPDELKQIVSQHQKSQQEQALKRGEFDKILQELAAKKDAEIHKRDKMIEEFKLNSPILDAAARLRSVNPEQVKSLVRNNVRLNQDGEPEVIDREGKVRYDDSGRALSVDSYVQEFLSQNPHFVSATPSTTTARSNVGSAKTSKIDVTKLDMANAEHRAIYKEYRQSNGIK